ncbi:type I secretion C-terminal target domain-containing protein [Phenylobacterium sp.]|uniref:type I secretion C-terminal target domain-containing protein n=1 Tax=Phenylobacterium sp. TaxID=1871053 RepID=UPI002FE0CEE3
MPGAVPTISNPTPPGGQLYGAEAGLPQGSQPGQATTSSSWTFTIAAEDGIDDLTVGGYVAIRDGVFTAGGTDLGYGRLSVTSFDASTGTVGLAFQLTGPIQSSPGSQTRYGDLRSFDILLTDRDGNAAQSTLLVQIRDDEGLHLTNDSASVTAGASATGNLVTSGTPDSFGADGFGGVTRIGNADRTVFDTTADTDGRYTLQGQYGVLSVSPTGVYSYAARADAPAGAVERFTYWAADGDGDEAAAVLTLSLQAAPPPPDGGDEGKVYTSPGPGSTVTAGAGDDTINASQGSDVLTGGQGDDVFAWAREPWSPATVTDFKVGADRLDLSALFKTSGYTGSDPMADGYIILLGRDDDTLVLFDRDGTAAGQPWANYIITLDGVAAGDVSWADLAGTSGSSPEDPPPPPSEPGQVLTSDQYGDTLVGGGGADTLNAGQGPDELTGAGGADRFVFGALPWNAGHVTDFTPGVDRLDLSAIASAAGQVEFRGDGAGNTQVYVDVDGAGGEWPFLITTLDGVAPSRIGASDWITG